MSKAKKGGRVTPKAPPPCRFRTNHFGRPMPHVFTSTVSINGGPKQTICSWCSKPQPKESA